MDKLSFGSFDSSNTDIAYDSTKGYVTPADENAVRKQLSYPIKEIKTYVNNTVPVLESNTNTAIQLAVGSSGLKYRTDPNGEFTAVTGGVSIDTIYPVGSVYMTVNNTNPSTLFSGTVWQLITSVMLASEHIFGNGKTLGVTDGTIKSGTISSATSPYNASFGGTFGASTGDTATAGRINTNKQVGVVTKEQCESNPENSGLVADTVTVYTWKRTA